MEAVYNIGTIRFTVFGFENACMAERVENKEKELILNNFWASVCVCVCVRGWLRSFPPGGSGGAQVPQTPHTTTWFTRVQSRSFASFFFFFFSISIVNFLLKKQTNKQNCSFISFWLGFILFLFPFLLASVRCRSLLILFEYSSRTDTHRKGYRYGWGGLTRMGQWPPDLDG